EPSVFVTTTAETAVTCRDGRNSQNVPFPSRVTVSSVTGTVGSHPQWATIAACASGSVVTGQAVSTVTSAATGSGVSGAVTTFVSTGSVNGRTAPDSFNAS